MFISINGSTVINTQYIQSIEFYGREDGDGSHAVVMMLDKTCHVVREYYYLAELQDFIEHHTV